MVSVPTSYFSILHEILRFDGTTGAYLDVYADSSGSSPLDTPFNFAFVPGHQVTVVDLILTGVSNAPSPNTITRPSLCRT